MINGEPESGELGGAGGEGKRVPREVRISIWLSILGSVVTGIVMTVSLAVWLTQSFADAKQERAEIKLTQGALLTRVGDLESNDKILASQDVEQAKALAEFSGTFVEARTQVQQARAADLQAHADFRRLFDDFRERMSRIEDRLR